MEIYSQDSVETLRATLENLAWERKDEHISSLVKKANEDIDQALKDFWNNKKYLALSLNAIKTTLDIATKWIQEL